MGILDRLRGQHEIEQLQEALQGRDAVLDVLQESMAQLELMAEDVGWQRMVLAGEHEFSRDGLQRIIALSRLMAVKNPLIRRAVRVQAFYVWGQGVEIAHDEPAANLVIQRFLDDPGNRKSLFGHRAHVANEQVLKTDGTIPVVLDTDPLTGHVRARTLNVDQVQDVILNPDDDAETWFYKRTYTAQRLDHLGNKVPQTVTCYHPDLYHRPKASEQTKRIGTHEVRWDQPIYWVAVGGSKWMRFGVPEVYAALDWARAHVGFLEDWSSLTKALATFAWKVTGKKSQRRAAGARLGSTFAQPGGETNPAPAAGSVMSVPEGADMAPIPKTGAQTSADDGRQLRLMVAAGTDTPDTMLSNDPQQGALATAKSLDRPTELGFRDRQMLWSECFTDWCDYALREHLRAGNRDRIPARLDVDPVTGVEVIVWNADVEKSSLRVSFPPILQRDPLEWIKAIVSAATLDGKSLAEVVPVDQVARLLLVALEVSDVDEIVEKLMDDLEGLADDPQPPVVPAEGGEPPVLPPTAEEALTAVLGELLEAVRADA